MEFFHVPHGYPLLMSFIEHFWRLNRRTQVFNKDKKRRIEPKNEAHNQAKKKKQLSLMLR